MAESSEIARLKQVEERLLWLACWMRERRRARQVEARPPRG